MAVTLECESSTIVKRNLVDEDDNDDCNIPCTYDLKPLCAEWKEDNQSEGEHEVFANPCFLKRHNECSGRGE